MLRFAPRLQGRFASSALGRIQDVSEDKTRGPEFPWPCSVRFGQDACLLCPAGGVRGRVCSTGVPGVGGLKTPPWMFPMVERVGPGGTILTTKMGF